ncbi:hypothetical protein pdam_00025538 [Pocillopora damicornis]|uniref:Alkylated DNA repair protein AlkB homologue 8 N-terminal domain-containing protein n=1 Tax=Pocillopora damicornis TaxID=46731 RepID=A0A3M6UFD2_POCDA|nr:hypothetical protein pdam_00025538 [Pocillopora damicornis]
MQDAVTHLERWAVQPNKMELNAKKTKDMWITFKKSCQIPAPINIGPTELESVSEFNLLGVHVQKDLKWNTRLEYCQQSVDSVESLVTRRQNLTRKEFKRILESEAHPCKRFLEKPTCTFKAPRGSAVR